MVAKFTLKKARNGKFTFNLAAGNGQVILSSEMYEKKPAAKNGIKSVGTNCSNDDRFERKKARNGKQYFVLKSRNGQQIGKSQMYKTVSGMENGIKSVKTNAPTADVVDTTGG